MANSIGDVWGVAEIGTRYLEAVQHVEERHLDQRALSLIANAAETVGAKRLGLAAVSRLIDLYEHALRELSRDEDRDMETVVHLSGYLHIRCNLRWLNGEAEAGIADAQRAILLLDSAIQAIDGARKVLPSARLAQALDGYATVLNELNRKEEAEEQFGAAIDVLESIRSGYPDYWTGTYAQWLASAYHNRTYLYDDPKQREAGFTTAIDLRIEAIADQDMHEHRHLLWLANGFRERAKARQALGNHDGATQDWKAALGVRMTLWQQMGYAHPTPIRQVCWTTFKILRACSRRQVISMARASHWMRQSFWLRRCTDGR